MNVGDLIASQLGLSKNEKPTVDQVHKTTNGVTVFRLSIPSRKNKYTVHLVRESDANEDSIEETAAVAGFYNAKYFHEMMKYEKIDMSLGAYGKALKIEDDGAQFPVFINERPDGSTAQHNTVTLDQLCQVAVELGKLHAFCLPELNKVARDTVDENHAIIEKNRCEMLLNTKATMLTSFTTDFAKFFKNAAKLPEMMDILCRSDEDIKYIERLPEQLHQPSVLCHGELSADKLIFNDKGKLVDILDWDGVHCGSVAEDLSFLMISSSSPEIRQEHYMAVFRHYYYSLIDHSVAKFKLSTLKESFKRLHKYVVLTSMHLVYSGLASAINDEDKNALAQRWECAIEAAVLLETDQYLSDDEDAFFSK